MRHLPLLAFLVSACGTSSPSQPSDSNDPSELDTPVLPAGPSADTATVSEGGEVLIDVLANDDVVDTVILITTPPAAGAAVVEAGGIRYTHDGSETVSDQLGYQVDGQLSEVQITVTPVNDPPVAVDDSGSVEAGLVLSIDVTANDTDVDDTVDAESVVVVAEPQFGTVEVSAAGAVDYTHTTRGTTSDSFRYTVADASGAVSNEAVVTIEVIGGCAEFGDGDSFYDRYEAPTADNDCETDADCVTSGCSAEICAVATLFSTCEVLESPPTGTCGCLDGVCAWSLCDE